MKDKPIFTHPVTFTGIDFNWGTNSETVYVPLTLWILTRSYPRISLTMK